MATQLILHIGTHKTGTTSLQKLLVERRPQLLEQGILYPLAGVRKRTDSHSDLASSIAGSTEVYGSEHLFKDESCWSELLEEMNRTQPRLVLLSSESFDRLTGEQVARVADYLRNYQVRIVVYLRNQWDYMLSYYKQLVEWRYPFSMRRCLSDHLDRCDYGGLIDRWAAQFGPENVTFRLFDRVKRRPGIIADFFEAAGLDTVFQESPDVRKNVSPSDDATRMLLLLNFLESKLSRPKHGRKTVWTRIRGKLKRGGPAVNRCCGILASILTRRLYSDDDKAYARERVAEFNTRFLPRLADPADASLFAF